MKEMDKGASKTLWRSNRNDNRDAGTPNGVIRESQRKCHFQSREGSSRVEGHEWPKWTHISQS